jgi:single stranded DNA-binding protein (ssb)
MNIFTFTGNLGKDCEVKVTQSGTLVCSFSVAVKSGYGDKAKATWVKCGLFGKRAEGQLPQYLTKGAQVAISGEAFLDEWQGQDGITQKMLKVNVDKLDLIGGNQNQQQQAPQYQQPQQAPVPQAAYQQHPHVQPQGQSVGVSHAPMDDDIPFDRLRDRLSLAL